MTRSLWSFFVLATLGAFPASASDDEIALDRSELIELVSDKTTECRKEKDQSLCANYFSKYGDITREMHADGKRKAGRWFVDDRDRLCILWKRKIKPLCFAVYEQDGDSYKLIRKGKHITTILGFEDGNTRGL